MATLYYGMNVSLDGYVDHDAFGPGPALFRHFCDEVRSLAGSLYGRGLYEVMRYWDEDDPEWDADFRDFAAAWRGQPKWVVSRTLTSVGPNATLIQGDLRSIHSSELPAFDGIIAGIPCTSHSPQGRAKKSLAGVPELGDTGDLYIPLLSLVAQRMPSFVVIENVPSYGTSLAGMTIESHLRKIGYHVAASVLEPHSQFGEPCNRRRWCCVATLRGGLRDSQPRHSLHWQGC